jgi:hypothetical protein
MRLTLADATPGVFSSARCTRPLQAAHVIPVTGMVQDSAGDAGASGVAVVI